MSFMDSLGTNCLSTSEIVVVCFPVEYIFVRSSQIKHTRMEGHLTVCDGYSYNEFSGSVQRVRG